MNEHKPVFISTTPVLASLDMARTVAFYARVLGARTVHAQPGEYAIVSLGGLELHFWACQDPEIPRQTSCRIQVAGIAALHAQCLAENAVHPNGGLRQQPWGTLEFSLLDEDGNCVTFYETHPAAAAA
ncbi:MULTISPECIES: VOC family protein [Comamonas]|uniref:bleomycin resistance protein n=1 Tax=Comamonas TaxID=283 RepID=UPI0015FB9D18|nr:MULTISPECIES: VOC family protein [Comamonas]UUC93213.1 VOC family protein [Comamonas sp. C11]WEE77206.1 VOC family protein [Comamonas testosteroni]